METVFSLILMVTAITLISVLLLQARGSSSRPVALDHPSSVKLPARFDHVEV